MKRSIKWTLLTALILVVGSLLSFAFAYPTASALALAVVSRSLPDPGHAVSIREELQAQADFMQLIKRHEDRALARYRSAGDSVFVAREIYRVDASFFLPMPFCPCSCWLYSRPSRPTRPSCPFIPFCFSVMQRATMRRLLKSLPFCCP
jgi:hypothetical protein